MARRRIIGTDISAHSALGRLRGPRRAAPGALLAATALLALAPSALAQFGGPTPFAAGDQPNAVAIGDFNADSNPDLAVANNTASGHVSVLLGGGDGTFGAPTPFSAGQYPVAVAVGDFDGVAHPDLAVANFGSGDVSVLLGRGDGTFTGPTPFHAGTTPESVAVGDFNADLDPDLALPVGPFPGSVSVLLGGPGGRFSGPTSFSAGQTPQSVAVGDFNADSRPDLAVANFNSANVSILLGNGQGGFTGPTPFPAGDQSVQPNSVAAGDFNADGHLDLAVANDVYFGSVVVLHGRGDGSFGGPTPFSVDIPFPRSVVAGDFNPGTPLDLAVTYTVSSSVGLMYGQGDGTFTGPADVPAGDDAESVTVGDLNHDSRPDLAVANGATDQVSVLLNNTATTGDDVLTGNARDNVICGLAGSDVIRGRAGDDTLFGDRCGAGAKLARRSGAAAADGDDRLYGGRGRDRLYGSGGADLLRGGPGADRLRGGAGSDRLRGGAGRDRLHGGRGRDRLSARGGGADRVVCGRGRDTVRADERDRLRGCERIRP